MSASLPPLCFSFFLPWLENKIENMHIQKVCIGLESCK